VTVEDQDIMTIKQFCNNVRQHLRDDFDCVIAITSSSEGEGKSTLAGQLGLGIDPKFDFRRNILYSPTVKAMKDLIFGLEKYSVIDPDEAIKILYKLKWGDKLTIFLNQLYALCRQENLATVLPMPRITDFVEFFRNHKIKFWLHIVERGTAVIFYKDWNPFAQDPWYMKENLAIIRKHRLHKKTVLYNLEEKIGALSKCQNFIGILKFEDLPEPHRTIYREMKRKYAYMDMDMDTNAGVESIHLFETAKEIIAERDTYIKEWHGKQVVDLERIMNKYNVGRQKASRIKKIVEDEVLAMKKKEREEKLQPIKDTKVVVN